MKRVHERFVLSERFTPCLTDSNEPEFHKTTLCIHVYYEAVVRPVLEYASPVWHSNLTAEQRQTIETVQRRACQISVGSGTYVDKYTAWT